MMYEWYLRLLQWLCRKELKRISNKYPITKQEVIRWHDFMAIECIEADTPAKDRVLGMMVATANLLEQ